MLKQGSMPRTIVGFVRRALRIALYYTYVHDRFWVGELMAAGVSPTAVRLLGARKALRVKGISVPLLPSHSFVLHALDSVHALASSVGGQFLIDGDGLLRCRIGQCEYYITTEEELRILVEIHVLGTYNFLTDTPHVVCDIGMNVGFASLYFAAQSDTLVYGFEPFRETYAAAMRNFALNPTLAAKITSQNVGLGSESKKAVFSYSYKWKGLAGKHSAAGQYEARGDTFVPQEVQLRRVCDALDEIRERHPGQKIVLKIDCEGAEYEILDSLAQAGYLEHISTLMIEWHKFGPDPLTAHLRHARFAVLSFSPRDQHSGMLYATRAGS